MSSCEGPKYNNDPPPERPRDIPPASVSITPVEAEPLDDMGLPEGPPTEPFVYPPYRPPLSWTEIAGRVLGTAAVVIMVVFMITVIGPVVVVAAVSIGIILLGLRLWRGSLKDAEDEMAGIIAETQSVTASKQISKGVYDGEEVLWETREHPISMLKWMGISLITAVAALWIGISGNMPMLILIVWLVVAIGAAGRIYMWNYERLAVTDQRLLATQGIFTTSLLTMPYGKLTDESLILPWHSRLLAKLRIVNLEYGVIVVESAGQHQVLSRIWFVWNAVPLNKLIMKRVLGG